MKTTENALEAQMNKMMDYLKEIETLVDDLIKEETEFCKGKTTLSDVLNLDHAKQQEIWNEYVIPLWKRIQQVTLFMLSNKKDLYPSFNEFVRNTLCSKLNAVTKDVVGENSNHILYRMCLRIEYNLKYSYLSPEEFIKTSATHKEDKEL